MSEDARVLIEQAARRFVEEVPALGQLKMIFELQLRGRGDVQQFRLQMPDFEVTKGPADDAAVRVEMRREFFNIMAVDAKVPDWIEAFTYGKAHASGPERFLKLIAMVVDKQLERQNLRHLRPSGS
ncbi:MAG TPA: hypothetical protein VGF95_07420 [Solirubrobacteraceae bacterium]|jgi:hypothetical protein